MKRCSNCGLVVKKSDVSYCPACGQEMAAVKSEAIAQSGQGYCMFCGVPFNEFGICAKCGNSQNDQIKATTKNDHYWDKLLSCVRALFSSSPFNGIENAGRETGHTIWPICLAAFSLFSSFGLANILHRQGAEGSPEVTLAQMFGISGSFMGIVLRMLLAGLISFFVSSALLILPVRFSRSKLPYAQLLNVNAFSLVPFSLSSLLAFIVAFFSRDIALLLLPIGLFLSVIMLYYALQKLVRFNSSPFWVFAGVIAGNTAVSVLSVLLANKLFG